MSASEPIINVRHLYRSYGAFMAVNNLSFTILKGQVVGFIGANGAGKTTTMRVMTTLDYPDAGYLSIAGYDVVNQPNEVRRRVGWMPDAYGLYDDMDVLDYLDFFARAFGFKGEERVRRVRSVMEFTDLTDLAERPIKGLSKGMGQRLCLGRTLIHDPDILILDEPAAGLDPKARIEFKRLIRLLAEEGKTVFISSHILSELGEMCDTMLFIDKGKIVHHGSAESLRFAHARGTLIQVDLHGSGEILREWADLQPDVMLNDVHRDGGLLEADRTLEGEDLNALLRRMVNDRLPVTGFYRQERRLEDAFVAILDKLEKEEVKHD